MQNKQLKSPPHFQSALHQPPLLHQGGVTVISSGANSGTNSAGANRSSNAQLHQQVGAPSNGAYGFQSANVGGVTNNSQSARHSAVSGTTSGSNRSNDRAEQLHQQQLLAAMGHYPVNQAHNTIGYNSNSSASNNYYYSQGMNNNNGGGNLGVDVAGTTSHHTDFSHGGNYMTIAQQKKKVVSSQGGIDGVNSAGGSVQQYATIQNKSSSNPQQRNKPASHSNEQINNTLSPPHNYSSISNSSGGGGIVAHLYQQQMGAQKKAGVVQSSVHQPVVSSNPGNIKRYESLQSKLKNNRRAQPSNNLLLGQNSSQINSIQISSSAKHQSEGSNLKFNQTQKIVASAFGLGGGPSNAVLTNGPVANQTTRKQLKLSLDQHSDSSFNNVSIKSADKHNSVVRTAAGLLTSKGLLASGLNPKDLSNQISPSSYNGGGSIIQNLASSQSSIYSSHFSNNSRFTNTRPKNPTDSSSLSSKNSDSISATGVKNILQDIKKTAAQKLANKQTTIQTIKDQQLMLIQQHQQSDSMSDTGEGSFNSNHEPNIQQQQKPLSTKACTSINTKTGTASTQAATNAGSQTGVNHPQMKASNSIQNLNKISSQVQIASANQSSHNVAYKSKFNLLNRPADRGAAITKDQKKAISSTFGQSSSQGGDSYRRNSDVQNQHRTLPKQANCGAPFSPKSHAPSNLTSKISASKQQQNLILQSMMHQVAQRNAGGLTIKTTGSIESKGAGLNAGSVGSISQKAKKSNRDSHREQQQQQPQVQLNAYESNHNFLKPPAKNQSDLCAPGPIHQLPTTKFNLDQLQNIIKHQQSQHKAMASETIQEERFEDSEQNTKRESTQQNIKQQSTTTLHNDQHTSQQQPSALQSYPQKSKSLLTINLESTENLKRLANEQSLKTLPKQEHQALHSQNQNQYQSHQSLLTATASPSKVEEIKSNPALQALKEQLKSQIAKQHHAFSNPNQPSSSRDIDEIQYPITPRKALRTFGTNLTDYEKKEILEFNEVFYLGLNAAKIHGSEGLEHNFGFDDDRGDYQVVLKDHLCYRYEIQDFLGKGSFGQAIKCLDYKTNEQVAVKIIRNKKRFHHQAGVELDILTYLREHDPDDVNNIIRIKDYAIFRKHLIISFELLSINLYEFIKNNNFSGVALGLIRRFAIQILQALKYQRDHGIIHCDLKPENILLKQQNKSGIKIIDYGSSCFQNQRIYTYIQSRFYRAPEIVLGIPYTTSIDMWSFGCILAELYSGYPLFPGENEMDQLAHIMEIKGVPEDYLLELATRRKLFFDGENQPIIVANSRGKKRKPSTKELKGVLKCSDKNFLNFVDCCLDWDPVNRMTPLEALQHVWILDGLPPKVLMHHQRMFEQNDDKSNIKEATMTNIQGFPADAESNSIFNLLNKRKKSDGTVEKTHKKVKQQPQDVKFDNHEQKSTLSPENDDHAPVLLNSKLNQTSSQAVFSQGSQSSATVNAQPKKNKTIQHFVQELFEEKKQSQQRGTEIIKKQSSIESKVAPVDSQMFYKPSTQKGSMMHNFKNQTLSHYIQLPLNKMKDIESQFGGSSMPIEVPDDDMEEGILFNKTQKIPISLIKQQEKIPVHQVPFYNPKVNGPKLNNYVSQAAAFTKKTHSSTTNLANRGQQQYQMQNYSVTLTAQQVNSSLNHPQNVCSMSNLNIMPGGYPDSSRSNNNNNKQQLLLNQSSSQSQSSNTFIPATMSQIHLQNQYSQNFQNSRHQVTINQQRLKTNAIKIDLSQNSMMAEQQKPPFSPDVISSSHR